MTRPLFLFSLLICCSCATTVDKSATSTFGGDDAAVAAAEGMFEALGGKEGWSEVRSLYVEAVHSEPQLSEPYVSRIWRDLEDWKVRIEQESTEFHRVGLFSESGGWVVYVDQDSTRELSAESLAGWRHNNAFNVYVLLRRLAREDGFTVVQGENDRIEFMKGNTLVVAFELDELRRPRRFVTRTLEGDAQSTTFRKWGTAEGLVHPIAGSPDDGTFSYETRVWQPSPLPFEESFDVEFVLRQ